VDETSLSRIIKDKEETMKPDIRLPLAAILIVIKTAPQQPKEHPAPVK
jgi:hypothetical protein